jgi:nicotinate phosphoribosyltransferase
VTPHRRITEGILYTDQYQLTMAQLYWRSGLHRRRVQFDYFFRNYPDYGAHQAGYCIFAGLGWLLEWMREVRFTDADLDALREQRSRAGGPLFDPAFLAWLREEGSMEGIALRGVDEGRVVHPGTPLAVVEGPAVMAQILETSLLNHLNYQTLIATKASRVREAGLGRPVLEFGLRRAQERGGNAGARAALIGGCDFTSNVGLSHYLGFDPKGTHAHSMVQIFMALGEGELNAFRAYADLYPDDCLLLVDTINTLESGVPNAIIVFQELRRRGHRPVGIRLDSGDLAHLAVRAAGMLDRAGFPDTAIVLSNQLDELVIWQIVTQIRDEAARSGMDADHILGRLTWGVGTRLITSEGAPSLDGVYKLVAVEGKGGWIPAIKISETPGKTLNAGSKKVWRIYDRRGMAVDDLIAADEEEPGGEAELVLRHPQDPARRRVLPRGEISRVEGLLTPQFGPGAPSIPPSVEEMRARRDRDLSCLDAGVKRLMNPHAYHVSLSQRLWELKQDLIRTHGRPSP